MGLYRDKRVPRDIFRQHHSLIRRATWTTWQRVPALDEVVGQVAGQRVQRRFHIRSILWHQHDIERRTVVNQDSPLAVVHHSAQRGGTLEAQAIVLGERTEILTFSHLQTPQARDEQGKCHEHQ